MTRRAQARADVKPQFEVYLSDCIFTVWNPDYAETRFRDGAVAKALFIVDEGTRRNALELGYGGEVRAMHVDHELAHTLLAEAEGRPFSPALWDVAHGVRADHALEEAGVLAFQRWRRGQAPSPPPGLLVADGPGGVPRSWAEVTQRLDSLIGTMARWVR